MYISFYCVFLQTVAGLSLCKCAIKIKRVESCFTYIIHHSEQLTIVLGPANVSPLWIQAWLPSKVNWSKTKNHPRYQILVF